MIKDFKMLFSKAKEQKSMILAVAAANDENILKAVCSARDAGLIQPLLIGEKDKIIEVAEAIGVEIEYDQIIDCSSLEEIAEKTVKLVNSGEADFLMKGLIDTGVLLKAVLNKEYGLRTDSQLSHVISFI